MVLPPSAKSQASNSSDIIGDHILHGDIIRHTAISLLLNSGAEPFAVQKLAGHSDVRLTTQTYAHVHAKAQRRAFAARIKEQKPTAIPLLQLV